MLLHGGLTEFVVGVAFMGAMNAGVAFCCAGGYQAGITAPLRAVTGLVGVMVAGAAVAALAGSAVIAGVALAAATVALNLVAPSVPFFAGRHGESLPEGEV